MQEVDEIILELADIQLVRYFVVTDNDENGVVKESIKIVSKDYKQFKIEFYTYYIPFDNCDLYYVTPINLTNELHEKLSVYINKRYMQRTDLMLEDAGYAFMDFARRYKVDTSR
jgi:hypothetical protein